MCGICGIYNIHDADACGEACISQALIDKMRDTMIHRGPDDAGTYISPDRKIGLGHRRLSIIDLSLEGHQPMSNEDGGIWITYNGEIYNHKKLRKELESRGHFYRSHTDTETILHLYEEKGIDCLHDLEGMFAFAIWDNKQKRLFLARDRIGIKPLYYAQQGGQIIFGSEIKAILAHPQIKAEIDPRALYDYLTFSVVPSPRTLFKGINKLPPGYFMVCGQAGNIELVRYWNAVIPKKGEKLSEEYYIEGVRRLLSESIEKRMMSDVPFGVFLSGGIDSSTNVALMSKLMDRPVDTFSVAIKNQDNSNEFDYARQAAKLFKTNHHEITISEQDFLSFLPKLAFYQDEPLSDPVCVPLYYVSKLAHDSGTIVIQVGEGSDEIFSGYPAYLKTLGDYQRLWRNYLKLPAFARQLLYSLGKDAIKMPVWEFARRAAGGEELFWGGAIAFYESEKSNLLSAQMKSLLGPINSYGQVEKVFQEARGKNNDTEYLDKMIYMELKLRLPELLLMRVDKMGMAASIEARVPFLDHKLVEFVVNIPPEVKIKENMPKYLLKRAVSGIIPEEIIHRKKRGFCGSASNMMSGEIERYARHLLLEELKGMKEYFDLDYVDLLFKQQREKQRDNGFKLWNLLNFALWYKQWFR